MEKFYTPVLLLTGYLGSGKTTLLNHILTNAQGIRFAVIVNDIGEVNIDANLIEKGGIVGAKDQSLVALQNGCICCTLQMDLVSQLHDIITMQKFHYIVIEASGICEPAPIASTICNMPRLVPQFAKDGLARLDNIVTVVDALRLKSEFGCGNALTSKELEEEDIENLIIQQIEFCNMILLNKASEVTPEELKEIKSIIRALQPKAEIIECDWCKVDLSRLLNTGLFNFEAVSRSAAWVEGVERAATEDEELAAHPHLHEEEEDEHEHEHEHEHEEHHEHEHEDEHEHGHEHEEHEDEHDEHHEHEHEHEHHHHHHHHGESEVEEYGISSFVYYRRPAFDLNKFDHFIAKKWPASVIRAKGICYFSNNSRMSMMFEQAGVQKKLTECGLWYATAPEEELIELMREEPGLMRDWDLVYGDRMQKIVFIGKGMDRAQIERDLDACLEEV